MERAPARFGAGQRALQEDQAGEPFSLPVLCVWLLAAVCLKGNLTLSWEDGNIPNSLGEELIVS